MEARAIAPLEAAAAAYADLRDRRMALSREETTLKADTLALMKQLHREVYQRDGIEIRIVAGEDDVKVKVKKPVDDDDADEAGE